MPEPIEERGAREIKDILLKGAGYGIRMIVPDGIPEEEMFLKLDTLSTEALSLGGGLGVVLDLQGRRLSRPSILRLMSEFIWPKGIKVLSWTVYDAATLESLKALGIPTGEPVSEKRRKKDRSTPGALLLIRSLRSGQRVEHDGDVVIIGHVNDGAEVLAGGSICVWGRLKGTAHGGLDGSGEHTVVAGLFEANHIRIGTKVSASLGSDMEWWGKPVIITVEENSLVVRKLKL